jgi:hypothetical protein
VTTTAVFGGPTGASFNLRQATRACLADTWLTLTRAASRSNLVGNSTVSFAVNSLVTTNAVLQLEQRS